MNLLLYNRVKYSVKLYFHSMVCSRNMSGLHSALIAILICVINNTPQPAIISFFRLSINLLYLLLFQWYGHEDDIFFDDLR